MRKQYWSAAVALALAVGSMATTRAAEASTLVALVGDRTLLLIDREKRRVTKTVAVTAPPTALLGIDVRPADGLLYGLTGTAVFTISPTTGAITPKSTLSQVLPAGQYAVDFNPVANLLRVVGVGGANFRINVDTGLVTADTALAFAGAPPANPFGTTTPNVVAVAYTNAFAGTKATLLFDIDKASSALYLQLPPNAGTLNAVGPLGTQLSDIAFDIDVDGQNRNRGIVVSNRRLFTIDLAGGKVSSVGQIKNLNVPVRDVAALPN